MSFSQGQNDDTTKIFRRHLPEFQIRLRNDPDKKRTNGSRFVSSRNQHVFAFREEPSIVQLSSPLVIDFHDFLVVRPQFVEPTLSIRLDFHDGETYQQRPVLMGRSQRRRSSFGTVPLEHLNYNFFFRRVDLEQELWIPKKRLRIGVPASGPVRFGSFVSRSPTSPEGRFFPLSASCEYVIVEQPDDCQFT